MAASVHPAATHFLPAFITAPGQTDVLFVGAGVTLFLAVLGVGLLFFRLHTLPERLAHKTNKLQFEIVAVLGLLSLFTHNHAFWVAGLLLAFIDLPDFGGRLERIAGSLEAMARKEPKVIPSQHRRGELRVISEVDSRNPSSAPEVETDHA
jgi:hypothetical protein